MGIRMKVPWDDGTQKLAANQTSFGFSPRMEDRLIRAGLAVPLSQNEEAEHQELEVGFAAQAPVPPAGIIADITMLRAELIALAEERGIAYEGDDNKADLVRKINEAG